MQKLFSCHLFAFVLVLSSGYFNLLKALVVVSNRNMPEKSFGVCPGVPLLRNLTMYSLRPSEEYHRGGNGGWSPSSPEGQDPGAFFKVKTDTQGNLYKWFNPFFFGIPHSYVSHGLTTSPYISGVKYWIWSLRSSDNNIVRNVANNLQQL